MRQFCCPGCEAVARTIVGQGLEAYYQFREASPERPLDRPGEDLSLYDDEDFQASFAIADAGGHKEVSLLLEGIRCAACVWLNEQALGRVPGVLEAHVNYATRRARIRWDPARTKLSEILAVVAAIGYRALPYDPARLEGVTQAEERAALWRIGVAALGMMQVMMYAVPVYLAEEGTMTAAVEGLMRWASLVLTIPVVFYSAWPFLVGARRDLRNRRLGMDVPVALGVGVAFVASVWATLTGGGHVYYDSVTMFVFLLLLGRFLELKARARAADAVGYLSRAAPAFAERLFRFPGALETERVPVARLVPGDVVLVRPGEAVPADGVVVEGTGEVSEALLTGESRPVTKGVASALVGGSINIGNALVMRVERVGEETVLAAIVRLMERAVGEKRPVVELADRVAHWFVLGIIVVAAVTAAVWSVVDPGRALWIAVSVLVVTCPCALSLATPVALTVGTGALARRGLVVTRGHAIEALARATDVVFDKTGTLTHGAPKVIEAIPLGGVPIGEAVAIAGSLETVSEHPIARAIVAFARERAGQAPAAEGIENFAGEGIQGTIGGRRYRVGRATFCRQIAGTEAPGSAHNERRTEVWVACEGAWLARFALDDALRAGAAELVAEVERLGKRVHIVSGDLEGPVRAVAAHLGIERLAWAMRPDAKRDYVARLQARGALVAMVGDGINDAPVIAQADVSVAMASGATLAQARADAILLSGEPVDLAGAIGKSTETLRVVRENLAWAAGYNLIVIPAAVLGYVTPWMAGLAMSASSLLVVLNALRLRDRAKPVHAEFRNRNA